MKFLHILTFSIIFTTNLLAFKLVLDSPKAESTDNNNSYIVNVQPLFHESDDDPLLKGQLLLWTLYSDIDRLYLWTTPINVTQENSAFIANETQPYPLYSTYAKDNIFDSPLTPLLSPARKAVYDLADYGFSTRIIGMYFTQQTNENLPQKSDKTGFLGVEAYSNWTVANNNIVISAFTF